MNHAAPSAADAPPAAPAKLPFSTHWTLLLLLFVYTMSFTDRQIIGILMQPIKTEFGVSDTAMGLLSAWRSRSSTARWACRWRAMPTAPTAETSSPTAAAPGAR